METKIKTNNIDSKKQKEYAVKSGENLLLVKDVDMNKKTVTGLYNTALYFDSDYDVVLKGAANRSISASGPNSSAVAHIKHLLFHDWEQLPGKIDLLTEKTVTIGNNKVTGIYFETKMADTDLGNDTLINYQEGVYDNHSIGFQYLDGEWLDNEADDWQKYVDMLLNPEDAEKAGFMYLWKEIKLFEGSTVAFGANQLTPYLGSKSMNKSVILANLDKRFNKLKKQLTNGKQSDDMMHSFEMQLLQIQQMVAEIITSSPESKKDTLKEQARQKDSTSDDMITCSNCGTEFNMNSAETQTDDDGDEGYMCPNCATLCMEKNSNESGINFKELLKTF